MDVNAIKPGDELISLVVVSVQTTIDIYKVFRHQSKRSSLLTLVNIALEIPCGLVRVVHGFSKVIFFEIIEITNKDNRTVQRIGFSIFNIFQETL